MARRSVWDTLSSWLTRGAGIDRDTITFIVAPSRAERTYQIEISRKIVRVLTILLIALVIIVIGGGVFYGLLVRDSLLLAKVRKENRDLQEQLKEMTELENEVQELDQIRRQLYLLAGVPEDEIENAPTGGAGDLAGSGWGSRRLLLEEELTEAGRQSPFLCLPVRGPVSRGFAVGHERRPEHAGIDVAGPEGTPIAAAAEGEVIFAGTDTTFGNLIVLRHRDGWETAYGHGKVLLVQLGDSVQVGQTIALLGSTGRSSAPHLHFEVRKDGVRVDPADYFKVYRSGDSADRGAGR